MTIQTVTPRSGSTRQAEPGGLVCPLASDVHLGVETRSAHQKRADEPDAPTVLVELDARTGTSPVVVWVAFDDIPRGCRKTDLPTLCVETGLTARSATERHDLVASLLDAVAHLDKGRVGRELGTSLPLLREVLRERMPRCAIARDGLHGLHVDAFISLGAGRYYVRGWSHVVESELARLTLVSPDGARAELAERMAPLPRPDVADFYGLRDHREPFGWACTVSLDLPVRAAAGWLIELEDTDGDGVEASCPPLVEQRDVVLETLLGDLAVSSPYDERLRADHLFPAVTAHLEQRLAGLFVEHEDCWGEPPVHPDVTIIVPLYRRIDFLEHQLAQFVHDPDLRDVEIIYVLDSPEQHEELRASAGRLHRLYGLPFRTLTLSANAGYSEANNIGAAAASGRLLLLLNSDVLPDRPGWLRQLVDRFDATPGVGAMGPKLLFEDTSLQHAGIVFERPSGTTIWRNEHRFKGLARDLAAADVACEVPAVSGACLLIERSSYDALEGLRGWFVQGDFEDTDLCLRLWEKGRAVWYEPSVELFHLESQSYPSAARRRNGEYNGWLHTHLWDAQIEELLGKLAVG